MDNEKKENELNGAEAENKEASGKKQKPKSFMQTVREIDAEERRKELEEEARQNEERAKREEQRRKAYEEKLRKERLELIKLKQGVISEEDIPEEKVPEKKYSAWEKFTNFIYHNKAYLIVGALFIGLAAFLIQDLVTRERPDISAMYIASDYDMSYYSGQLTPLWSQYGEDVNGNGEKLVRLYYIPAGYEDNDRASAYLAQSDRTKLIGEFQSGNMVMVIGDKESYQELGILDGVFADCRELFPDDPYAEEIGYRLAGTDFMELLGCDTVDDTDLYVSFRKPMKTMGMSEEKMQTNFDYAVDFWRNFLSEHRVDGLELEAVPDPEPLPDEYAEYEEDTDLSDTAANVTE